MLGFLKPNLDQGVSLTEAALGASETLWLGCHLPAPSSPFCGSWLWKGDVASWNPKSRFDHLHNLIVERPRVPIPRLALSVIMRAIVLTGLY